MNKTNSIKIRCTDDAKNMLYKVAADHGMNISQYIWWLVDEENKRTKRGNKNEKSVRTEV